MTNNDMLAVVRADFNEARKHGEKASNATLRAAIHLREAIMAERFGAFAPDWWTRDISESGVIDAVLRGAECHADNIKDMRASNKDNPGVAAALADAARILARDLRDALPCVVAMLRLQDRTGEAPHVTSRGVVQVPAIWYWPEDAAAYEMQRAESREAMLSATVTKGRAPFFYLTEDAAQKVIAARDAGMKPDAARMEKRGEANVSREGIVRLVQPKPAKGANKGSDAAKPADVSDASVKASADVLASRLARDGGAVTGEAADALESVYAALVANDATWSLLVALRQKHERDAERAAIASDMDKEALLDKAAGM
jgi:hypothetical protein